MTGVIGWPVAASHTPGRAITASGREPFPTGIECGVVGPAGELDRHRRAADRRHVPEPGGRVGADGQHARAVRCEPDALQDSAVIERRRERLSGRRIPDPGHAVEARPSQHDRRRD